MSDFLQAALDLAAADNAIFPLKPRGKKPLTKNGFKDATKDPSIITRWWKRWPHANIGLATGPASGCLVADLDGAEGESSLQMLEQRLGPLPATCRSKTGNGQHLFFRHPDGIRIRSRTKIAPGIDLRADGGYVVAPPSIHPNGTTYEWLGEEAEYANLPQKWIEFFSGNAPGGSRHTTENLASSAANPVSPSPHSEDEEVRLRSALACIPATDRGKWLTVGMGIHWLRWGENGFRIWDDWSRTAPDVYDEADQQKTWQSFGRPYSDQRIAVATIYYLAKQNGWTDQTQPAREYQTDLGNARRLVQRHGENLRFIHQWRKWIMWTGDCWRVDEDGAIIRIAKETVESMYSHAMQLSDQRARTDLLKHALKCQALARIDAMVKLAESEPEVVLSASQLNADAWLLGVQNGVIDLKTNDFRPGQREDLITFRAGVSFDPDAKCPNWLALIDTVTGGDETLKAYVQRVVGYVLTGSVREEVMFVLYGTGNNGKSTFREALHKLMGDYATAADAGLLIERNASGTATPEIARLQGRRFVAINETAENDKLNEARVKFLTSQDTITGRKLHENYVDFYPTHKTFLTTNHKPIVRNADIGIWRRIHLLAFTVTIPQEAVEKDFLAKRLMPELPGILNWAVQGLAAYRREGLNPPAAVLAATKDYREEMDVVGQWLEERCECDPQATVGSGLAYNNYRLWAEAEIGWSFPALKFRRQLSDRGFGAKKNHGQRQIVGLRLKPLSVASMTPVRT